MHSISYLVGLLGFLQACALASPLERRTPYVPTLQVFLKQTEPASENWHFSLGIREIGAKGKPAKTGTFIDATIPMACFQSNDKPGRPVKDAHIVGHPKDKADYYTDLPQEVSGMVLNPPSSSHTDSQGVVKALVAIAHQLGSTTFTKESPSASKPFVNCLDFVDLVVTKYYADHYISQADHAKFHDFHTKYQAFVRSKTDAHTIATPAINAADAAEEAAGSDGSCSSPIHRRGGTSKKPCSPHAKNSKSRVAASKPVAAKGAVVKHKRTT